MPIVRPTPTSWCESKAAIERAIALLANVSGAEAPVASAGSVAGRSGEVCGRNVGLVLSGNIDHVCWPRC
jgi:hypothetical protein